MRLDAFWRESQGNHTVLIIFLLFPLHQKVFLLLPSHSQTEAQLVVRGLKLKEHAHDLWILFKRPVDMMSFD